MLRKLYLCFFVIIVLSSCATKKDIVYFQNNETLAKQSGMFNYEPLIQPDDMLFIYISAEDMEAAMPFNFTLSSDNGGASQTTSNVQSTYLVDSSGDIEYPVLGKMHVSGLTRTALIEMFKGSLKAYIINPIVHLRIMNYKVSVLGEVGRPGNIPITSERITLVEAIGLAGDLTIYGKRDNILVMRDIQGQKSFTRVDITQADFVNSPFYYLAQNDVVYVEPNPTKIRSSAIGPNISLIFSIATFLITVLSFSIR